MDTKKIKNILKSIVIKPEDCELVYKGTKWQFKPFNLAKVDWYEDNLPDGTPCLTVSFDPDSEFAYPIDIETGDAAQQSYGVVSAITKKINAASDEVEADWDDFVVSVWLKADDTLRESKVSKAVNSLLEGKPVRKVIKSLS